MPATFADGTNLRYAAMPAATRNNLTTTGLTIAGWIRQTAFGDGGQGGDIIELVTAGNGTVARLRAGIFGNATFRFTTGNATTAMSADFNSTGLKNHEWIHVCVCWDGGLLQSGVTGYINGVAFAITGGTGTGVGAVPVADGAINVGHSTVGTTARDVVGMMHNVACWNTVLTATEAAKLAGNGYRAHKPIEIQPTRLFLNTPFDGNTDNECNATTGTPGAKTNGTPTLTNRVPGDIPGVGFWLKTSAPGNTITASRLGTVIDYAGSPLTAAESGGSGPIVKTPTFGLTIAHASCRSDFDKYIDNATGASGVPVNARRASILAFVSGISTQATASRNEPRYICALGDPATNGAGKAELWINTSGFPVGGEAGTTARTTGTAKRIDCASPRLMGAVFKTGGVDVWADDQKTTGATPCTAATSTGIRFFSTPGTRDYWFEGRVYDVLMYQRPLHDDEVLTIRAAFRDADATAGISGSYFSDATGLVSTVGSSSMFGYQSDWTVNLFVLCQPSLADRLVYNFGAVSAHKDNIASTINTHLQAADVLALFAKANRHAIIQPFGNDYDGTGTNGYGFSTTYDQVLASYQASVNDLATDYAKIGHWETIARGSVGGGVVDDANIAARERARQRIFSDLTGVYRFNFDSIAGLAVTQSGVDATLATNVHTITTGVNYNVDEVHLDDDGFALLRVQFNTRIDGLFSAGTGAQRRLAVGIGVGL